VIRAAITFLLLTGTAFAQGSGGACQTANVWCETVRKTLTVPEQKHFPEDDQTYLDRIMEYEARARERGVFLFNDVARRHICGLTGQALDREGRIWGVIRQ
jgi:hypothetical protein